MSAIGDWARFSVSVGLWPIDAVARLVRSEPYRIPRSWVYANPNGLTKCISGGDRYDRSTFSPNLYRHGDPSRPWWHPWHWLQPSRAAQVHDALCLDHKWDDDIPCSFEEANAAHARQLGLEPHPECVRKLYGRGVNSALARRVWDKREKEINACL